MFYSAFFELSIGFERVLKLVLILDRMAHNQLVPPNSKTIEGYGHKLRSLFDAARKVCAAHGVTALDAFQPDSLPIVILVFLDEFAHPGGRYSNINKLTGHRHQAMADPIARWGEIANRIMREQATPRERKRVQLNGLVASAAFGGAAVGLISDLDQQAMDVAPLHVRASELDTAAKHAIYALVSLIAALREVHQGGSPMTANIARQVVRAFHRAVPPQPALPELSARETEVLQLLARGFLYKEIADNLNVAVPTVNTYIRRIYEKLQVRSRTEAVARFAHLPIRDAGA